MGASFLVESRLEAYGSIEGSCKIATTVIWPLPRGKSARERILGDGQIHLLKAGSATRGLEPDYQSPAPRGGAAMGRGRAKAKQTKVARDLKYNTGHMDLNALQAELAGSSAVLPSGDDDSFDGQDYTEDPYAKYYDDDDADGDSDGGSDSASGDSSSGASD